MKISGLGDQLYVDAYDLSGDIGAVQSLNKSLAEGVVTGLDKSAIERILLLADGEIGFANYYDPVSPGLHAILSDLPDADALVSYFRGQALGAMTASLLGKQINYGLARGADGSLIGANIAAKGSGYGLEYGNAGTAGKRTDTGATTGAGADCDGQDVAVAITSSSVANPTHIITPVAHRLVTGDWIVIAGHSGSTPDINKAYAITWVSATEFTIAVNVTVGGTGGTLTKTSTALGCSAYLHVFSFTGTSMTAKLQHSADDAATDAYTDITGGAFAAFTGIGAQRIQTGVLVVKRWIRVVTTGTFNPCTFAVAVARQ